MFSSIVQSVNGDVNASAVEVVSSLNKIKNCREVQTPVGPTVICSSGN